jgi:hypothetical protein
VKQNQQHKQQSNKNENTYGSSKNYTNYNIKTTGNRSKTKKQQQIEEHKKRISLKMAKKEKYDKTVPKQQKQKE